MPFQHYLGKPPHLTLEGPLNGQSQFQTMGLGRHENKAPHEVWKKAKNKAFPKLREGRPRQP